MGRNERIEIIKEIEQKRKSNVITYVLSDRPNSFPLIIADDAIRPIYKQLQDLPKQDNLDLFIYTRGGSMMASYRIIKLLRSHCKKFSALVPWRAHSGGTQICLGANSIVMTDLAELSPVDPSTANQFNPFDRMNKPIPISVEDIRSYFEFAAEKIGLKSEQSKLEIFKTLTEAPNVQTHPIALGNVNRVYDEIRLMIENLLHIHMNPTTDKDKIDNIIHNLTEVYTHDYPITRDDAIKLDLKIEPKDPVIEELTMKLYEDYEADLELQKPFDAEDLLGAQQSVAKDVSLGYIETMKHCYVFKTQVLVNRPVPQPMMQFQQPGVSVPVPVPAAAGQLQVRIKPGHWSLLKTHTNA